MTATGPGIVDIFSTLWGGWLPARVVAVLDDETIVVEYKVNTLECRKRVYSNSENLRAAAAATIDAFTEEEATEPPMTLLKPLALSYATRAWRSILLKLLPLSSRRGVGPPQSSCEDCEDPARTP